MKIPVRNMQGETTGELEVRDDIFGIEPNESVMHQALKRQLANARQGTADTKTRAEVEGGTRKMYKQKGTGRARQGDNRAPHWRKGGIVGGPTPRDHTQAMPKKMRRLALKSALSVKARDNRLFVLEELRFDVPRTKDMRALLKGLEVDEGNTLLLLEGGETNVVRSADNLPGVKTLNARFLNVMDLLSCDAVVAPRNAIGVIEQTFGG